jgi:hypothetical protein
MEDKDYKKQQKEKVKATKIQLKKDRDHAKDKDETARKNGTIGEVDDRVADVVLQSKITLLLGKRKIKVNQPSVGTIIRFSGDIARLPNDIKIDGSSGYKVIACAKEFQSLAKILAGVIVGSRPSFFRNLKRKYYERFILRNATSKQVLDAYVELIKLMDINFLAATITSLCEIRLLQSTK